MQIGTLNTAASEFGSTDAAVDPRLKPAAHEFEASLMQEFLKPLQQRDALFSDTSDSASNDDSGADGALMSFGSQAMAKAISERGGFGIATQILKHFEQNKPSGESKLTSSGNY